MPIMNSYSVVAVDQCVDANLLRSLLIRFSMLELFNTLFLQQ